LSTLSAAPSASLVCSLREGSTMPITLLIARRHQQLKRYRSSPP
jgi:hypothetical protein